MQRPPRIALAGAQVWWFPESNLAEYHWSRGREVWGRNLVTFHRLRGSIRLLLGAVGTRIKKNVPGRWKSSSKLSEGKTPQTELRAETKWKEYSLRGALLGEAITTSWHIFLLFSNRLHISSLPGEADVPLLGRTDTLRHVVLEYEPLPKVLLALSLFRVCQSHENRLVAKTNW